MLYSLSFPFSNRGYVWEWITTVWDNCGRNIKLDQAEFIYMDPLSGESRFNMEGMLKKESKVCLNGYWKHLSKESLLKRSWRC